MSMAFNGKSGEVEGDGWNLMASGRSSKQGRRCQSSVCWIGAAAVCGGLLLLTLIMVGHNTNVINQWDTKYSNLIRELTKGRDDLKEERDQLKIHSDNLTQEMEVLQRQYDAVVASRDKLQEDFNRLNVSKTDKPCHSGWTKFENKCYYSSPSGMSKTWENSRKDCQSRGADLVIITTKAELDFVKRSYDITWIGLYRVGADSWKWVDGTDLVGTGFWQNGEPNNADGAEDCVEVSRTASAWNDAPCKRKFSWMCEV